MAKLDVLAVGTIGSVLRALLPKFERESGIEVGASLANPAATVDRVARGEPADLAIVANSVWDAFAALPRVDARERHVLARTAFAAGLKAGSVPADISTEDALQRVLASVTSLGLVERSGSTPALHGGFERLGLARELAAKTRLFATGEALAEALAAGAVDMGITTKSELLSRPEVVLLGALPPVIAPADTVTIASVLHDARQPEAARHLLAFLSSADAQATFRRFGHPTPEAKAG